MLTEPEGMSAGTVAVIWVALTTDVGSAVPFQYAAAPTTKFVPLMVSVKAGAPAYAVEGLRLVMAGVGIPRL